MAITVNWITGVISVPKADMTLVQSVPTEIRQLDINQFRLTLRDLEEDPDGRPWPQTHTHNTEVTVGGVTLARVVEILDPYTVTFEDGQYAVNLVGANSNIGDKVNVNQVSVRSGNSAGLVSSQAIEFGEYADGVWVDQTGANSGQIYPLGTRRQPVNNIPDAVQIASFYGVSTIQMIGDATIDTGDDVTSFKVLGQNASRSDFTLNPGGVIANVELQEASITGTLDGNAIIRNCYVEDITYFSGYLYTSAIGGTITLGNNAQADILDCYSSVAGTSTPTIDMGGTGQSLGLRGYKGGIKLTNKTGPESASIDLDSGQVQIDLTTCTAGTIVVRGVGKCVDAADPTDDLLSGTYGGLTVINETVAGKMTQELWQRLGLDPDAPLITNEDGSITVGNITITANTTGTSPNRQTTQTRT